MKIQRVLSHVTEFDGKSLQSVAKGALDLGILAEEADAKETEDVEGEFKPLAERMQKVLGSKTQQVRVTSRLTDSPACLVSDHSMSRNLERILKEAGQGVPPVQPVMEINPRHPIVERLKDETDDQRFSEWTQILFDHALLAEGGQLDDPASYVKRLNGLLLALTGKRSRIWTAGGIASPGADAPICQDSPYMSRQSFTQPSLRLGALGSLPSRAERSRGRESV